MKAIYVIISIAALVFLAPVASAVIINIPGDYPTIQEGIDAAQNGDTVLVAPGLYVENPIIEDKNILLGSSEGPEATTILGHLLIEGDSIDSTCVLRGFRIRMDIDDPWENVYSLIRTRYAAPIIVGNIIEDNATIVGAGIRCGPSSAAIIRANIIRNNFALDMAGAISASIGNVIEQNIISNNSAGFSICERGDAGAIRMTSEGTIRYNLIIDNETYRDLCDPRGGGILKYPASHTHVYNNTIVGNSARRGPYHGLGGGIIFGVGPADEDVFYKNNIIAFNPYGGGVHGTIPDSVEGVWDYNLVFGNGGGDYIEMEPGPHDIQEDPLFVDRFSGDYHLLPNSPCIDAGDPDFPLDPDGSRADIGAYYFDQAVGIEDLGEPSGPYQFQLHQNYPNPFNAQTIISYTLSESSSVSLMIFSITGHFVKSIVNKEVQQAGEYRYIWDGGDKSGQHVATGIYFYELYVNEYRESKAMIMIK